MATSSDAGFAFPTELWDGEGGRLLFKGMTLRDYFAAKAMQAYLTSIVRDPETPTIPYMDKEDKPLGEGPCYDDDNMAIAAASYWMADAMLAQRAKET